MSINEQVKELRAYSNVSLYAREEKVRELLKKSADTIETLSAKLQEENMERSTAHYNGGWIPCSESLPNNYEHDWVLAQIQEDSGFMWIPKVMEYRESLNDWYCEETGWLSKCNGAFAVIAWQPLPDPYKPQ